MYKVSSIKYFVFSGTIVCSFYRSVKRLAASEETLLLTELQVVLEGGSLHLMLHCHHRNESVLG